MPLMIELFSGLHGWGIPAVEFGYRVVGFDIVDMCQALKHPRPPGIELVLQDVLTLHGSQFRNADLIVASPPCTEYSYMAMPWSRAKQIARALRHKDHFPNGYEGSRSITDLNALFDACSRLQAEASEASGHYIPLVIENVKGAQPWVGQAKANFGSFYLWGDVERIGRRIVRNGPVSWGMESVAASGRRLKFPADCGPRMWRDREIVRLNDGESSHAFHQAQDGRKGPGGDWFEGGRQGQDACAEAIRQKMQAEGILEPLWMQEFGLPGEPDPHGQKNNGGSWFNQAHNTESGTGQNPVNGVKVGELGWNGGKSKGFNVTAAQRYREENGDGVKSAQDGQGGYGGSFGWNNTPMRRGNSRSDSRKAASAQIAKIPPPLALHIARIFKPGACAEDGKPV